MVDKGGDRIMELKNRSQYLGKLISVQDMEVIKVVTGIRRCGKSYLLGVLFWDYLLQTGVPADQIITLELDNDLNAR